MKIFLNSLIIITLITLSCASGMTLLERKQIDYPNTHFAVITDIHYYSAELGNTGYAFEEYINNDRKLLLLSKDIMCAASDSIKAHEPDFTIVCGDLTKDGEMINHRAVADILSSMNNVYVIPGNHDINNPHAFSYSRDEHIESVNASEFKEIYNNCGYNKAIYADSNSLSYIAEPVEGLFLIALDCCVYDKNKKNPETSGYLKHSTFEWLKKILSKHNDKAFICILHHPIVEHFTGMKTHYPKYVLRNNKELIELLVRYNVKLTFTGHFHANDITSFTYRNRTIFDIETGSLVTFPSPVRFVSIEDNMAHIETIHISNLKDFPDFSSYSETYIRQGIMYIANTTLKSFGVNDKDREELIHTIADAFVCHYRGDEPVFRIIDYSKLSLKGKIIAFTQRGLVENLVNDLPPGDNNIIINLNP